MQREGPSWRCVGCTSSCWPRLLHNSGGSQQWIDFKLVGTRSNRDAVGARVTVTAGGRRQLRQVSCGSAYLSNQSLVQHFGLGTAREAEQVEVQWPSGAYTLMYHVPADQLVRITEDPGA